ncbi:collagen alpha-1(XI) chain [Microcaecilia unicolor]|uniref:Collagen alpha-1(XI) chain-like n=1 Tax=Microcaecilia unicolor TaxID=1415580 RepID=A0A6P7YD42_9AMPH|nr:collagen alpha-1(XI) chain-like [Microcaecilia unicolor]
MPNVLRSGRGAVLLLLWWGAYLALVGEAQEPLELSSGQLIDEVNLLDKLTVHSPDLVNVSLTYDEANCSSLEIGQYSTLSLPTKTVFGNSFVDELSVLIKFRYSLKEDTSLLSILNIHGQVLFQIRINPHAFIFVSVRRGDYEFPVSFLSDGEWHCIALSISAERVELHVDCKLMERIAWTNFFGIGVTTDGLVLVGGLIEPFEIPFEGSLQQLMFVMGDPGAAKDYCSTCSETCLRTFSTETVHNQFFIREPSTAYPEVHTPSSEGPENSFPLNVKEKTSEIQETSIQITNFTTFNLTLRPSLAREWPNRKGSSFTKSESGLTRDLAARGLLAPKEDDSMFSIADEGYELWNITSEKIHRAHRPGSVNSVPPEITENVTESVNFTLQPLVGLRNPEMPNANITFLAATKLNRQMDKEDHTSKPHIEDQSITTDKLREDQFPLSKPVDVIINLDEPSTFTKLSVDQHNFQTVISAESSPQLSSDSKKSNCH